MAQPVTLNPNEVIVPADLEGAQPTQEMYDAGKTAGFSLPILVKLDEQGRPVLQVGYKRLVVAKSLGLQIPALIEYGADDIARHIAAKDYAVPVRRENLTLLELAHSIELLQRPPLSMSLAEVAEMLMKEEKFCRRVLRISAAAKSRISE